MGSSELSHQLLDMGFFCALGTIDNQSGGCRVMIQRQQPRTLDYNNGVLVVVDDEGRPWIMLRAIVQESFESRKRFSSLIDEFDLVMGTHVPHSNDGAHFVRNVLPKL